MKSYDGSRILAAVLAALCIVSTACAGSAPTAQPATPTSQPSTVAQAASAIPAASPSPSAGPALRSVAGSRLIGTAVGLPELEVRAILHALAGAAK